VRGDRRGCRGAARRLLVPDASPNASRSFSVPVIPAPTLPPIEIAEPEPEPDSAVTITETRSMKFSPGWNPPDEGQYFWQIVDPDEGYPETGGTIYVLAHACESQKCAGDALRELEPGDSLSYKGTTYRVDSKTPVMKDQIGDLPIWTHVPGRLVLFTCIIETTWDQSNKNDVIVASPVR